MKHWTEKSERGSAWLIHLVVWLAHRAGRRACRMLLYPISFYFLLGDPTARRSSAEFFEAVHHRKARWHDVFAHIYNFAATLLDRVYMASGNLGNFEVTVKGLDLVDSALASGKGCVLLGSHLGSFDLMRLAGGTKDGRVVSVMMRIDPRSRVRRIAGIDDNAFNLIPLGRPDSYLRAHEALASGGVVALLADRVDGGSHLPACFMDRMTRMPTAPHILAARSGAPVLMFFGLYEGQNRYRIEFVECGEAAHPKSRGDEFQPVVDSYTRVLEDYARRFPRNWFNFYPYWNSSGNDA